MAENLLNDGWANLDSHELRLFLDERIGGPGQYDGASGGSNKLYLPLAGTFCRVVLTFDDKKITAVEPGPAFNPEGWREIYVEIEKSILTGPRKIGREFMASRQWTISFSSSFASLVSAIESLTDRGVTHQVYCAECGKDYPHEVPGATERFRAFFEKYAPGAALKTRRTQMYSLRSGILHGSDLMQLDQDLGFGWDPPGWDERELHRELWSLTRIAMRNWLKASPNFV
jgi:hypothetical protein